MTDRCERCGAEDRDMAICPRHPRMQMNVFGLGWQYVPNRVSDCLRGQEDDRELLKVVEDAYMRARQPKTMPEFIGP